MQQFLLCAFGCFCGVGVGWYVFFRRTKIINIYLKRKEDGTNDDTGISKKDVD